MLSKFDDYPIHQTSRPLATPVSHDRNSYDRYWFNGYDLDGGFYFGIAAGRYPNLGIMDCAFTVAHDGVQYAFHGSRRAPAEPSEIEVGPFKLEIIEPMKTLRVTLDDNDTGIACDLLWTPRTANLEEGFQYKRFGNLCTENTRFDQFGQWSGEIRYPGGRLDVKAAKGTKDRSWGLRPVGDPAPPGAPSLEMPQSCHFWAPIHWEQRCTMTGIFCNQHGEQWHWDGAILPAYSSAEQIPGVEDPSAKSYTGVDFQVEFVPGTRRIKRAEITARRRDGGCDEISVEPQICARLKGIGYTHPTWGHGFWKGELAHEGESWSLGELDELAYENQHLQQVVTASCNGEKGVGVVEQLVIGPLLPYGLVDFMDPAKA